MRLETLLKEALRLLGAARDLPDSLHEGRGWMVLMSDLGLLTFTFSFWGWAGTGGWFTGSS